MSPSHMNPNPHLSLWPRDSVPFSSSSSSLHHHSQGSFLMIIPKSHTGFCLRTLSNLNITQWMSRERKDWERNQENLENQTWDEISYLGKDSFLSFMGFILKVLFFQFFQFSAFPLSGTKIQWMIELTFFFFFLRVDLFIWTREWGKGMRASLFISWFD